jgi:hypothetical protein
MSDAPRLRLVCLTALVVLAFVHPVPVGARAESSEQATGGDVGTTIGAAVERHPSSAGATAEGLRSVRADAVHAQGLTGAGVDVGVIGRGFETGNGVIRPHVVDRWRTGGPAGSTGHDAAVAAIVSETAPSADLYLAGVGRAPTPAEYASAVEWLTDRGVDVIVDSGSYFPSVAGDGARITAAAERATGEGVVFVTSAGNYATRHWRGNGTADGWVTFAEADAANAVAGEDPVHGRITVRLRWQSAADYDLYLYRRLPTATDRVVAKSTSDRTGPGRTVEGIDVAVPRGQYYVAVYADDATASTAGRVQLFSARHELEHTSPHGSMVAPATSDRVVAVGAATEGELTAYSSLSPNGTVDLVAPADAGTDGRALVGSSAAAPYVAGTAALMQSGGYDPSPARVEAILERTADGERDALDALDAVEAATASGGDTAPGSGDTGDRIEYGDSTRPDDATDRTADDETGNVTRSDDDGVRPADSGSNDRSDTGTSGGSDRNGEDDPSRTDERNDEGTGTGSDGDRDRTGNRTDDGGAGDDADRIERTGTQRG